MKELTLVKPNRKSIVIDDKKYTMVYDFNAFAELEEEYGTIQNAFDALTKGNKVVDILKILHAGLASNKEVPSLKVLGSHITLAEIPQIAECISECIESAMPKESEEKAKN